MRHLSFTDQELITAVKDSISKAEILRKLNLVPMGANYITLNNKIRQLRLSTSHLLGKSHLLGQHRKLPRISFETVLTVNSTYNRACLKRRLIADHLLINQCAICGCVPLWRNKLLVLVLDHKNGINNDNRLENLRLVCPNCNSQLPTFCGRKNLNHKLKRYNICVCGKQINKRAIRCINCENIMRSKNRPTLNQLLLDFKTNSQAGVARKYNVSHTTVRRWLKSYNQ